MNTKTFKISLTFEDILNLAKQLSNSEQNILIKELQKNIITDEKDSLIDVCERIGRNAQTRGLTEEKLADLLADES
ncbi:hypothetical protein [Cyanobacterium aponinum]|uniref:Uncharacterized protein n=1 Tax=Cyanobacterium aponinum (strain PCC 10605) TaxID=755178 RepID=K9Z6A9_CYAAP|nr:hypothetical protein [Cyanobacterium aponinum]AFZ53943.1 hypothetical protein Cyan10605_1841 [Cyanobacterium aponinum PCC 10605]